MRQAAMPTQANVPNFWLAVGRHINWLTTFAFEWIWGLRETQRHHWEAIQEHRDLVFFYVTVPVGGVVGYGAVRTKLRQNSPRWPEELDRNEVIWPLRFEFDVLSALPPATWKEQRVFREDLKLRARGGFQRVDHQVAQELMRALPTALPAELMGSNAGATQRQENPSPLVGPSATADPHGFAQMLLVEIGRMQKFLAEPEFPIENRRLDVAWRRVQRSVPSYVFEVQVGGNLTEALGKLKQARDLWNSNIYLVGKEEHRGPATQLLDGTFHEMRDRLRFIEIGQVEQLYERKRSYRDLENQLGILV
jgi:hypothetical protein